MHIFSSLMVSPQYISKMMANKSGTAVGEGMGMDVALDYLEMNDD